MLRRTLNLGILAHVDAGKTTLTERLLYAAGVIDEVGSVDHGSTQTDTLALEQQRGITIKAAVVSFAIGDVTVNLIDTPGHPDFIAEVERVLSVLDGAVLVVSAVEGVQPQTRILMRALQRLCVPTLIFVNKIDRQGADGERVLQALEERVTRAIVPMGSPADLGTRAASYTPFGSPDQEVQARARRGLLHPVLFGSALTGAGVEALMSGIAELLPAAERDADGPVSGSVFKIERGPRGERIAYVRMFSGTVRTRDRLPGGRVNAIGVFDQGSVARRASVSAGHIAKVWGLGEVEIGDAIGEARVGEEHHFPPPTLETVVVPCRAEDKGALRVALGQLAEQDPLIDVRQDEGGEMSVSLYGEVQKEVIQATLASDYGLDVGFRETKTICVERPARTGEAVEALNTPTNPFRATIGLRIEPGASDFRLQIDPGSVPLFVYKTVESFAEHMAEYVRDALREGLLGWEVRDAVVTMISCEYSVPDGPPSRRGPLSTAADFRKLTPLVVRQALERAGTVVCEPVDRFHLELPADTLGPTLAVLGRLQAVPEAPTIRGSMCTLEGDVPAARVQELRLELPAVTRGEGVLECGFARYEPVTGPPPRRS